MMNWSFNEKITIQDSPIIPVVHGTDEPIAWKIATSGFASLSILDSGYYGKGIYFSTSAQYTLPYFGTKRSPVILICLAVPGNPYPVIEPPSAEINWSGKHMAGGHQSHYVVTTKKGLPFTEQDYVEKKEKVYDELVLQQDAQVVPIFLLKINPSNFLKLMKIFQREEQVAPIIARQRTKSTIQEDASSISLLEPGDLTTGYSTFSS